MGKNWSGNYRAPWHDYRSRQIYHITLMKCKEAPAFGTLAGDWKLRAGQPGSSHIWASELGRAVKSCLRDISHIHPSLRILQYALMPDHLHLILYVESTLDDILGRKLAAFKVMANTRAGIDQVFERGFNDQILTSARNLDVIYTYLRENPYRLAVRRANPDYFKQISRLMIGDNPCQAYGNVHLLDNPFKDQVIVHRADSPGIFCRNRERWIYSAANNGVLVSPFISKKEKEIRLMAENVGGRIILITNDAFGERFKPSAHDFGLCAEGRLLILSLGLPQKSLTREVCLRMNKIAENVAMAKL